MRRALAHIALLAVALRAKRQSLNLEEPSRKQLQLLSWWAPGSPYAEFDGVIADGAIRSGKTTTAILGFVLWSTATFEGENFIIAGRTVGSLKRNVVRPMIAVLRALGRPYTWHRSENWIRVGTNTYYLFGGHTEASQDDLAGLTAAGALVDETTRLVESFVKECINRCSVDGAKLWFTMNPGPPRHYFKLDYIDKAEEKRMLRLQFVLDDNPTLSEARKAFYKRMFTGLWFKRYILGLWVAAEGAVYDMFDEDAHVVEQLPPILKYWTSLDYGTSGVTVFLLIGLGKDNCLYVCREYVWDAAEMGRQRTDKEHSDAYRKWVGQLGVANVYPDPSAVSLSLQMSRDGVRGIVPADNTVIDGIRNVAALLSAGRLKCHESCTYTIENFQSYVWDSTAQAKGEDRPVKENDHAVDAVRYAVRMLRPAWKNWVAYEAPEGPLHVMPHQIANR